MSVSASTLRHLTYWVKVIGSVLWGHKFDSWQHAVSSSKVTYFMLLQSTQRANGLRIPVIQSASHVTFWVILNVPENNIKSSVQSLACLFHEQAVLFVRQMNWNSHHCNCNCWNASMCLCHTHLFLLSFLSSIDFIPKDLFYIYFITLVNLSEGLVHSMKIWK